MNSTILMGIGKPLVTEPTMFLSATFMHQGSVLPVGCRLSLRHAFPNYKATGRGEPNCFSEAAKPTRSQTAN